MKTIRFAAAALLAVLAACSTLLPHSEAPDRTGFYVMRHLDKAEGPDPGLNEQGRRSAARVADLLAAAGVRAIYVSTTRRARETAAPLAGRLGLAPAEYDPRDTPALVARVRAERGPVLVVGHSNTVPDIVEQLGGTRPAPIAEDRYGDIWHVSGTPPSTMAMRIEGP